MVKTPHYPEYSKLDTLLPILDGIPVPQFKNMWNAIWDLRGTPQNSVDWTDPDTWIGDRLQGTDKTLALNIWKGSNHTINPRYIRGAQFLINGYKLIDEVNGVYQLSQRGKEFISSFDNTVKRELDKEEGLIQLLFQASSMGKGKRADFMKEWKTYLDTNSNVKEESVVKDYLRVRLVNLADRNYLKRVGNVYEATDAGRKYLDSVNQNQPNALLSHLTSIGREIEKYNQSQRELMRQYLEKTTPVQFENLIKDLLLAMGYEDIKVTAPTNDKGVDVTAVIQKGITTLKEVIQVKRFTKINVQRPVLDGLRGSLHRFDAFQGTIITLSDFAKGARDAAYEKGAAPITLINGEKLIDLLIEYELIVKRSAFSYYTLDESYFSDIEED